MMLVAGPLSTSHALFDKTRFVAHIGVAYYAFHHWVLTPYKGGQFASGSAGRTVRLIKGGAALLFAAHELNVAERVAHNSKDPLLQKLDASLIGLKDKFTSIGSNLKKGQFSEADIQSLDGAANDLSSTSAAGGTRIKDIAAPIPGL